MVVLADSARTRALRRLINVSLQNALDQAPQTADSYPTPCSRICHLHPRLPPNPRTRHQHFSTKHSAYCSLEEGELLKAGGALLLPGQRGAPAALESPHGSSICVARVTEMKWLFV